MDNKLIEAVVNGIEEKKGTDIKVIDLRGQEGAICSWFVLCNGQSPTQVEAICDSVAETTRLQAGEKPMRTVGRESAVWVAMDYGEAMVHIFVPDTRAYYDLDSLWES